MLHRFFAEALADGLIRLQEANAILAFEPVHGEANGRQLLRESLPSFRHVIENTPLREGLLDQLSRLGHVSEDESESNEALQARISEFEHALVDDLGAVQFFRIAPSRVVFYVDATKQFGEQTSDQFPEVARDARDAYQCFALEQWTATVFHSMRILEQGLWWLAAEVGIPNPEKAQQGVLIDQIEKQIKLMRTATSTPTKEARLTAFSQAALEFGYFKDAWRNHVAHSRESYDEQDAKRVIDHVTDFMGRLAGTRAGISE